MVINLVPGKGFCSLNAFRVMKNRHFHAQLTHLLQFLIFLHVLLRSVICSLRLLFKGFIIGHQCSLLRQQCGQTSQQPGGEKNNMNSSDMSGFTKQSVCIWSLRLTAAAYVAILHYTDTDFGIIIGAWKGNDLYNYYLNKHLNLNTELHGLTHPTHLCSRHQRLYDGWN